MTSLYFFFYIRIAVGDSFTLIIVAAASDVQFNCCLFADFMCMRCKLHVFDT